MRIECNHCHEQFGEPVATGGIFTIIPAGIVTGVVCGILAHWIHGWVLLIAFPLWLSLAWILWEWPRWLTSLRYSRRRCPSCGACDWKRPRYSGFGL